MKNLFMDFIKALIFSIILTLIALVVLSLVLSFSEVSESLINPAIIVISSVSILIGGFLVAKKIKQKGILNGAILGIVYMLIIYLISSLLNNNFSLGISAFIMIGAGILSGALGGIVGVNLKAKI